MDEIVVDINCDVAEGLGNEAELFPYITSCNIAAGGHAGDPREIRRVVRLALEHQVKIGAHPGYPDKENFGRKPLDMDPLLLGESIRWQVGNVADITKEEGGTLHHVKAHGALYNQLAQDEDLCQVFLEAIAPFGKRLKVYAPYNSTLEEAAVAYGYPVVQEAFADRVYQADLSLRSRVHDDALLTDKKAVLGQLLPMLQEGVVVTQEGQRVPILAQTYCLHGDTPGAPEILAYLAEKLPEHGIQLK